MALLTLTHLFWCCHGYHKKRLEHGIQMMIPLLTHSHHLPKKMAENTNAWWICGKYLTRLEKCSSEIVRDTQQ